MSDVYVVHNGDQPAVELAERLSRAEPGEVVKLTDIEMGMLRRGERIIVINKEGK